MTATTDLALARPRPAIHFTATDGWINDPYGIAWVEDRYHLYYQAIPGQVAWGPNCHWGHAVSHDLVHWQQQPLVLVPAPDEVGCWSGSVVHDHEPPTIFYTRVTGQHWEIGAIATATPDEHTTRWRSGPDDVVVQAPPPDLGLRCFRDPFVFRYRDEWIMLVAAALPEQTAGALQYRSSDLQDWSFDGVLFSRRSNRDDPVWTGSLWECPQLTQVGDRWVLTVSVWDDETLHYVAGTVGDYDGHAFRAGPWQQLTHGDSAYAMAAFTDRGGRPCVMSWLREEPRNNESLTVWAGAHSVVSTVTIDEDGLILMRPHPDVDALRGQRLGDLDGHTGSYAVGDSPSDAVFVAVPGTQIVISEAARTRATLTVSTSGHELDIHRAGFGTQRLTLPIVGVETRLLLDADIIEIFAGSSYGAYRISPAVEPSTVALAITGIDQEQVVVRPLHV